MKNKGEQIETSTKEVLETQKEYYAEKLHLILDHKQSTN